MENQYEATKTDVGSWRSEILRRHADGNRFAGMYGTTTREGCQLTALLATKDDFVYVQSTLRANNQGVLAYPSLTPQIPAAFWYERAAHDLSAVVPLGHPRLDPLLLPLEADSERPHPGRNEQPSHLHPTSSGGPVDVEGHGMFTVSFGPVRSGVAESIEFLIESPGEDIPHLNIRPHYKHRGIAKRFEGLSLQDGVLVAERVEGIASVAHALAFSHAAEALAGSAAPPRARLLRVIFAEFERIANHLDVAMRLSDAAGLGVAISRFSWHKERIMRLTSRMCGNRFGRNVVIPGGVNADLAIPPTVVAEQLHVVYRKIKADADLAMRTPSFLDRLRGTGVLTPAEAATWAVVGPIARASGVDDDNRWHRATDAYPELAIPAVPALEADGDAVSRLRVRWSEIDISISLIFESLEKLETLESSELATPVELPAGDAFGLGWSESPQGETLYGLAVHDGQVQRCFARSASFQNLVAFHDVFKGDVFTDFAFIEASFGLSYAGVAM